MMRENKRTLILTSVVCLIPIIVGLLLYDKIPAQIATHWDINGEANGWSSKFVGIVVFPGILFFINLLFPFLLKMDPKYNNVSNKVKSLLHWIIPIVCLFASTITLSAALGVNVKVEIYAPLFCGVLFVIIGNYLPKVKQSYMVGIKLPWTLSDEENWNKTHRMAGFLWVLCGLFMILFTFFPVRIPAFIILFVLMILVPTVYSYLIYRRKK
ncbi:MAG: SdpI family protein [Eubacteriales bacterium]|nr:SdpI family protein [Eubacteriales bacterium]